MTIFTDNEGIKWAKVEHPRPLNYVVSEHGVVRNATTGKTIAQQHNSKGYAYVNLYDKGVGYKPTVHQLVMFNYNGTIENYGAYPGGMVIDHIDNNRSNNHYSNLQYLTHEENSAKTSGTRGEKNGFSKLTEDKVKAIKYEYSELSSAEVGKMFDCAPTTVRMIRQGKRWAHV